MKRTGAGIVLTFCLAAGCGMMETRCYAKPQEVQAASIPPAVRTVTDEAPMPEESRSGEQDATRKVAETDNNLGMALVKNTVSDQKAIWTSPAHLRWADGAWLFPLAVATATLFATDRSVPPALSSDSRRLSQFNRFSNYGLYSLVGASGGLYLWGKLSGDDHKRETGILAGEAAVDVLGVNSVFKYSFGRERPYQGQGLGNFFDHGTSFASDHSAVAWSVASVIAHEYPGPLTKLLAYGMATAVSVSRVGAKQHFPSDVLVGSAMGWLIGWQVYRAHHDPDLGGAEAGDLSGNPDGEDRRDRHDMGSPFVPLDSWVYAAIERLAGLGYVGSATLGLRPWTRIECARLTDEAGEGMQDKAVPNPSASALQDRLQHEFAYELGLLDGGRNLTASLESLYTRAVSISGPPLTDSYHFGQTISYDFGRPFERGMNGQAGGSFSAAAGPLAIYVRAEYQHAPAAPALSDAVRNVISFADGLPLSDVRFGALAGVDRPRLLDAYAAVNVSNWQIVIGNQSLSWGPGNDSLLWSDNTDPVHMIRVVNPESFRLPGPLKYLGPVKVDQFVGRLEGHSYIPRPFVYGQKLTLKPFPSLELGFARRGMIGGAGGDPITAGNLFHNFVGTQPVANGVKLSVPGDTETEMDWTIYVPHVRNLVVLYGDAYAEDDVLPIENPPRNVWHPGFYLTRIPGIPKLDLHLEGVSTEQGGAINGTNHGDFNYWNSTYRDGNTNNGNLIGNSVGRDGRVIEGWLTYWISPRNTLQFDYKHNSVSADFIPGGGAWQDYSLRGEFHLRGGYYVKSQLQLENISHYPLLFQGQQRNFTLALEMGFSPEKKK